jgi:cysteine desulfurase
MTMKKTTLYLDNHATTPLDSRVLEAMMPFLTTEFGNPSSVDHRIGREAARVLDEAKGSLALSLGCDSDELIFTSGATESNNLAVLGIVRGNNSHKSVVCTSGLEHACVREASEASRRFYQKTLWECPVDQEGFVDMDFIQALDGDKTLLLSIIGVHNEFGTIQDTQEIARLCNDKGIIFHSDLVHAPLCGRIDLHDLGVGLASFSGHKIYGPKGIGLLYVRRDLKSKIEPLMYGGGQQDYLRSGTLPLALCVGLAKAFEYIREWASDDNIAEWRNKTTEFAAQFVATCPELKHVGPSPNQGRRHPGNLAFALASCDAKDVLINLSNDFCFSLGSACSAGSIEPSKSLGALIKWGYKIRNPRGFFRLGIDRNINEISLIDFINEFKKTLDSIDRKG